MMFLKIRIVLLIFFSILAVGCKANDARVTMKNIEEFKSNFVADLPVGTAKSDVVSYLKKNNIQYTYIDKKEVFYASIPKIGRYRLIYVTSLFIHINLDESKNLKSIEFDLQHDGL
jgi:hypothetical protein